MARPPADAAPPLNANGRRILPASAQNGNDQGANGQRPLTDDKIKITRWSRCRIGGFSWGAGYATASRRGCSAHGPTADRCVGEFSVNWNAVLGEWLMTYGAMAARRCGLPRLRGP